MADFIKIAFLDLSSLEALLLKCVAKELQEVKLCTRNKINMILFPSVIVKWPIRNNLYSARQSFVLCLI